MSNPVNDVKSKGVLRRLFRALRCSYAGFQHAIQNEAAMREELIALAILVPVSVLLPVSNMEHLVLVSSMMLVVLVEFVNSAIETIVDRISMEPNPLSGQAKDMASAAVCIALLMSGLCWVVIAGPVVIQWIRY
jgi:diacylglycerol kinase (ATP)